MAKILFVCANCGAELRKWMGQCPECGEWNTVAEQAPVSTKRGGRRAGALDATPITDIDVREHPRRPTGIDELDRVLGGGLVPGSAVLIGGDPGIGKSTLLLQAAGRLAGEREVLYISGEESDGQIKMRGERVGAVHDRLGLTVTTDLASMLATIEKRRPAAVIVDSIQTTATDTLTSAPGTVSQVRDCAAALVQSAKQLGHALVLVGHVTKDGSLAGPRVLEHMVDAVLYFEGDRGQAHRILRAIKNRFGPAGEIGVFEMSDRGLVGIRDASRLFLAERATDVPGSVVLACLEGTRPLLVEVQALVAPTVYATPKRSAVGIDAARVAMLTAVLERRAGVPLAQHDVYVNVAGGVRIGEPAADVAVLLAMLSAFRERPVHADMAVFGEVGLTGEVRPVSAPGTRGREAASLGFSRLLLPQENHARMQGAGVSDTLSARDGPERARNPIECVPVRHLREAATAGLA